MTCHTNVWWIAIGQVLSYIAVAHLWTAPTANAATIESTFDVDLEGWSGTGGAIFHQATGGNPGGFLRAEDPAAPSPLRAFAPAALLGDLSAFNGGLISFDGIALFTPNGNYDSDFGKVDISSTAGSVSLDLALGSPIASWTTYSAPLTAAAWGLPVDDWLDILADVTSITLHLEFDYGAEVAGVDNFALKALLPGDGNRDGWVDGLDYLLWAGTYGTHPGPNGDISDGDYNDDGWVDGLDYLLWAGEYGSHASATVPEPATSITALFGLMSMAFCRRRVRVWASRK